MKANELMIGDWIRIADEGYNAMRGEYHQIDWIRTGELGLDNRKIITPPYAEPIPLTPEILEKNGMKVFEHRNPWQGENLIKKWYSKDGRFYVSYYRVGNMFTYTVGNNVSRICGIKNVHELQHALRLCRIEKEITL